MTQKENFIQWLKKQNLNSDALVEKFETFQNFLVSENAKINLFSRKTSPQDLWTLHFLDSLLPAVHVDFCGRRILDFGTGGGMPGIPLAVVFADSEITLLDSTKKKIAAVKRAAECLQLSNCKFIDTRMEEIAARLQNSFDIIVCRSVKIEPAYKPLLLSILKPHGKIVLYKSKILDDVEQFDKESVKIFDASMEDIGERKIVVIEKL